MFHRLDAMKEVFEEVSVLGKPMLFTPCRIERSTVPHGLYMYEVRYDDDGRGDPVQIAKWVRVNHWGTLISSTPIKLDSYKTENNAFRDIDPEKDWHYEGADFTVKEYMERHPPKKEKDFERYIDAGVIPKFAGCGTGVQWFKDRGLWQDRNYEPRPGDIIFFDWNDENGQDGDSDHVGIVEKVEDGVVYTVEGNSGDVCQENRYAVGYFEILGYGTPAY